MKKSFTLNDWWGPYELSGTGVTADESGFIVLPDNDPQLKTFWDELLEGPYELSGTGVTSEESNFIAV